MEREKREAVAFVEARREGRAEEDGTEEVGGG